MKIDNFMLTMHQTCPAKYDLRINQGWTTARKSGALGFGASLHAGLAAWYRHSLLPNKDRLALALQAIDNSWPQEHPVDDYRTREKCLNVMYEYSQAYPQESFQIVGCDTEDPMVEVSFTLDTGMLLSCFECGPEAGAWEEGSSVCPNCGKPLEPIEYGGIFDTLADASIGQIYILEHKSTSQLGDYYFDSYKPNNQVTGYIWAASRLTGQRVGGAIINAIGVYKVGATRFKRQPTARSEVEIQEWLADVRAVCEEIQWHRRTGYWPKRTSACTLYGKCEFHQVHSMSGGPGAQRKYLEQEYVLDHWDYEKRD